MTTLQSKQPSTRLKVRSDRYTWLSRISSVGVVQSAEPRHGVDATFCLCLAMFWAVAFEAQVDARGVVVRHVLIEHLTQMVLAEHDYVIQTFAPDAADHPFHIPVLPRQTTVCLPLRAA